MIFFVTEMQHARSYDSVKKVCYQCELQTPSRITSVSMRKYTATLTQVRQNVVAIKKGVLKMIIKINNDNYTLIS